jgi:hypothetical protein
VEQQHFYPISEIPLFEQIVKGLEITVEDNYPLFKEVSKNPSILPIDEVISAISMFNEHPQMVELSGNQYKYWRDSGVSPEQEKKIVDLENREKVVLVINSEILGFLNA